MRKLYFFILLLFANFFYSQTSVNVQIQSPAPICNAGECTTLTANYSQVQTTSDYAVQSIPFVSSFPLTGGTQIGNTYDDVWSPTVNLPFTFCFYGTNYDQLLIGTNGVVTFDVSGVVPGATFTPNGACPWSFTAQVPNTSFPIKNAIYGVFQDTDIRSSLLTNPATQNVNYYITGTAPNRKVIINFNQLPLFSPSCNNLLQTSQIILYETTNVIDINITNRTACTTWNGGNGVVGIQNQAGTLASVPTGRNTGNWSATNEAWRFLPNGGNVNTEISWYEDNILIPTSVGQNSISICPTETKEYKAQVSFTSCNGSLVYAEDIINIGPEAFLLNEPLDLIACSISNPNQNFNINQDSYMLGGLNAGDYDITYYNTLSDAQNYINQITPTAMLTYNSSGETIYVRVEDYFTTGCIQYTSFNLIIQGAPPAPTSLWSTQIYTDDTSTLADLQINESIITWYDAAINGTILPSTTLLIDGSTYYATQTDIFCGFESIDRLAVTVQKIANSTQVLPPGSTVGDLVVTPSANSTVLWYTTPTGGSALNNTDILSDGLYYVEQITNTTAVPNATNTTYVSNRAAVTVDVSTLSTSSFDKNIIAIYPNPSNGLFKISVVNESEVKIYNYLGELVFKRNLNSGVSNMNISDLSSGIYILNVSNSNTTKSIKIIKQ